MSDGSSANTGPQNFKTIYCPTPYCYGWQDVYEDGRVEGGCRCGYLGPEPSSLCGATIHIHGTTPEILVCIEPEGHDAPHTSKSGATWYLAVREAHVVR